MVLPSPRTVLPPDRDAERRRLVIDAATKVAEAKAKALARAAPTFNPGKAEWRGAISTGPLPSSTHLKPRSTELSLVEDDDENEVVDASPEPGACPGGACALSRGGPVPGYTPLYPALFEKRFRDEWLASTFVEALRDGSEAALRAVLHPELPGRVFSFELLKPEFCTQLLDELVNYEASGMPVARPNSMNAYGVIVNQIGMKPLIDDLQQRCLLPLTRMLFPKEGGAFNNHHSFMVQYKQGEDLGLDMHHDDSDVTLNVCLGREFTGATLCFCGGFGAPDHRKHTHTYRHAVGRAILHLGSHRHGADDIVSGERYNLIVWSHGPFRETDEYREAQRTQQNLHGTDKDPDPLCLSYTHDPDFGEYKAYPAGKAVKPESRRAHLQRFGADEAAAKAAALKARGTDDYKAAEWAAAACKYHCAADYARSSAGRVERGLLGSVLLNEAQCRLKLDEPAAARDLCSSALEREPDNVKGLFRRALAHAELREFVAAQKDLVTAARLEPNNKAVRTELQKCRDAAAAEREKERRLFTAMLFGGDGAGDFRDHHGGGGGGGSGSGGGEAAATGEAASVAANDAQQQQLLQPGGGTATADPAATEAAAAAEGFRYVAPAGSGPQASLPAEEGTADVTMF